MKKRAQNQVSDDKIKTPENVKIELSGREFCHRRSRQHILGHKREAEWSRSDKNICLRKIFTSEGKIKKILRAGQVQRTAQQRRELRVCWMIMHIFYVNRSFPAREYFIESERRASSRRLGAQPCQKRTARLRKWWWRRHKWKERIFK